MARMLPRLTANQIRDSAAERVVYQALQKQLPSDAVVIFRTALFGDALSGRKIDLEADFVIVWPGQGILVVEVKGGGVKKDRETGHWHSVDRHGREHEIKDPFEQAKRQRYHILRGLQSDPRWNKRHSGMVVMGHAVLFPDVAVDRSFSAAGRPLAIIGGVDELRDMRSWVLGALDYMRGSQRDWAEVTHDTVTIAESLLCGAIDVKPLLSAQLRAEDEIRIRLTNEQAMMLRVAGNAKKLLVDGGAGTGKTVIALARAKECAKQGQRTLLLCYQRRLGEMLAHNCQKQRNLRACTFHKLCEDACREACATSGMQLRSRIKQHLSEQQRQLSLDDQFAAQLLVAAERNPEFRFDSIIVDEAQMMRPMAWMAIQALLKSEESHLTVFRDPEQSWRFGSRSASQPGLEEIIKGFMPLSLWRNCRNTAVIHELAYRRYRGKPVDPPSDLAGESPEFLRAPELAFQDAAEFEHAHAAWVEQIVGQVREVVLRWVLAGKVPKHQVAVLLCSSADAFKAAFRRLPDPKDFWAIAASDEHPGVRVETLRRYQGLEAECVILVLPDKLRSKDRRQAMYIGPTRARSRLVVIARDLAKVQR